MNTQTTVVIVVALIMWASILSPAPAVGKAGELTNLEKLLLESEQLAPTVTPKSNPPIEQQREQLMKDIQGWQEKKERGTTPSERRTEFFAQLTAYSIIGVSIAIAAWLWGKWKNRKK